MHWKDWCWSWNSNTLATLYEVLTHWRRPWCWERLKAREPLLLIQQRMASPTWWTWVWASSGSWWWTGKPGVLRSTGLQRVGHNWVTELILPQTLLPFRLTHNTEQSSLCCYSRSLLVIHFNYNNEYMSIPNSLTILSPHSSPLATLNSFSESVNLFLFYK